MAEVFIDNDATSNGAFSGGSPHQFTATGDPADANAGQISGYLAAGENVVVTSTAGASPHSGITVQASINGGMGAGSLELDTDDTVAILAAVVLTGTGSSLVLHGASRVIEPGGGSISANLLTVTSGGDVNLSDVGNTIATLGGLTAGANSILRDESDLTISGAVNLGTHDLQITETGSLTETAGAPLTAGNVSYTATGAITLAQQSQVASLSLSAGGAVTLSGATAVSTLLSVRTSAASTASGAISGAGALQLSGAGTLTLTGANTYTGGTTVSGGVLQIGNGGTTGSIMGAVVDNATLRFSRSDATTFAGAISGTGAVTVNGGGALTLSATNIYQGGTTVTNGSTLTAGHTDANNDVDGLGSGAITLDGGTLAYATGGASGLNNAVVVGAAGGTINLPMGGILGGRISGAGALTFTGNGAAVLTNDDRAFTGAVSVTQGLLQTRAPNALTGANAVTLGGAATLDLYGTFQAVGSLSGTGVVTSRFPLFAAGLTVGALGTSTTFSGVISSPSGDVSLTKVGAGVLTLTGANSYTGDTTVTGGVLAVDGSLTSAVTVASGGTLRGTGTDTAGVTVQAGGTFAPGDYASGASSVGHLTTGAITLAAGAHFAEQLGGAMGAYDQVTASGDVALGGATLDLSVLSGFTPTSGVSYDILHLTAGTLSGRFAQGASVMAGGYTYAIHYTANDVTLTYSAPPPPPPPAPSGPPAGSHVLTSGADSYMAGNGGERVYGEGGSDTILGGTGNDTLVAGGYPGQATVGSTSDHTLIEGGSGNDSLTGGVGHDQIFGQMGNDHVTVIAGSQGASVYGGQGDDIIDASASNAPNYLSGDIGNDTLMSGAGFETVLGGQGDDVIVGSTNAGAGSLQLLLGNQGNDRISYAAAGSVEIFGGQGNDTLSVTTSGQGQMHLLFGNLGNDTLTASGGYNSLYGGQGDDVVSASGAGHNYLSGDIGNDAITSSSDGFDTVRGGPGADTITLNTHASNAGDTVLIGAGDSTAAQGVGETNLDHIAGFNFASDHIMITGHAAGTTSNVTTYMDGTANSSEAAAFASAYTYAFGDGTAAHTAHVGATEYLAVSESYGGTTAIYVFTADHTAVAFTGVTASSFQADAIVGG